MIKKIFLFLVLLALLAAAAVYFLGSTALNKGIKQGVETYGPKVTQTPVTLAEVNLSVFSGKGTLTGLNVGNPEGFKNENIFALGQIDVEVDTGTVFSDKIVINKIYIRQPEISYEKTLRTSNVKKLLENIEAFTGPAKDTPVDETPEAEGAKKQVVIKQLIIEDGTIFVGAMGIGQTVPLPRIEMNDLGENNNKSMAQIIDLVLTEVLKSIGPAIASGSDLLKGTADDAAKALQETGVEKAGEAVNKATDSIKGLFNK